jgi:hypothetical protein
LIESFYNSIVHDTPVPIPYREILLSARIMDDIFDQLNRRRPASVGKSGVFHTVPGHAEVLATPEPHNELSQSRESSASYK